MKGCLVPWAWSEIKNYRAANSIGGLLASLYRIRRKETCVTDRKAKVLLSQHWQNNLGSDTNCNEHTALAIHAIQACDSCIQWTKRPCMWYSWRLKAGDSDWEIVNHASVRWWRVVLDTEYSAARLVRTWSSSLEYESSWLQLLKTDRFMLRICITVIFTHYIRSSSCVKNRNICSDQLTFESPLDWLDLWPCLLYPAQSANVNRQAAAVNDSRYNKTLSFHCHISTGTSGSSTVSQTKFSWQRSWKSF